MNRDPGTAPAGAVHCSNCNGWHRADYHRLHPSTHSHLAIVFDKPPADAAVATTPPPPVSPVPPVVVAVPAVLPVDVPAAPEPAPAAAKPAKAK